MVDLISHVGGLDVDGVLPIMHRKLPHLRRKLLLLIPVEVHVNLALLCGRLRSEEWAVLFSQRLM